MKSNYFYDVVEKSSAIRYLNRLDSNVLFIYSPTSFKKIDITNDKVIKEDWHKISKNVVEIDKYIKKIRNVKEIVTFGGGSVIDIGKYISYKLNITHTCIPSMLSTNSYATDKVALIDNEKKITINVKMPNKIIVDKEILQFSNDENLYGLADVLSIYTALYDWKIANEDIHEPIDIDIYNQAEKLLEEVLDFIKNNSLEEIVNNSIKLFEFIGVAGYITNLYGTGRPESGSEHILAKEIERRIEVPHGISVSVGIIIMSLLQNRDIDKVLNAILKMKIFDKSNKFGLTCEIVKNSFFNLEPRKDRYTIINRFINNDKQKENIMKKFFKVEV